MDFTCVTRYFDSFQPFLSWCWELCNFWNCDKQTHGWICSQRKETQRPLRFAGIALGLVLPARWNLHRVVHTSAVFCKTVAGREDEGHHILFLCQTFHLSSPRLLCSFQSAFNFKCQILRFHLALAPDMASSDTSEFKGTKMGTLKCCETSMRQPIFRWVTVSYGELQWVVVSVLFQPSGLQTGRT